MDNQDLERENLDPRLGSWQWFVRKLKDQHGFVVGDGSDGGGDGGNGGAGGSGAGAAGAGAAGAGAAGTVIDPSTIDFSKLDWSKANWKGEFADDPAMVKHKDPISLIKATKELEQFVGMEKIPLPTPPKEGATAADIEKYNKQMAFVYGKLGRPESPEKYEIKAQIPQVDEAFLGEIKKIAHAEGMSNKQLDSLLTAYGNWVTATTERLNQEQTQRAEAAVTAVKQKWGATFPQRVAIAGKAYNAFVKTENLKKLFGGDVLGNDPDMMEFFFELGNTIGEDTLGGRSIPLTMTPEAAKQKIQELRIQQGKTKEGSPEYKLLQEQINNAYKIAHPDLAAPE